MSIVYNVIYYQRKAGSSVRVPFILNKKETYRQ